MKPYFPTPLFIFGTSARLGEDLTGGAKVDCSTGCFNLCSKGDLWPCKPYDADVKFLSNLVQNLCRSRKDVVPPDLFLHQRIGKRVP